MFSFAVQSRMTVIGSVSASFALRVDQESLPVPAYSINEEVLFATCIRGMVWKSSTAAPASKLAPMANGVAIILLPEEM